MVSNNEMKAVCSKDAPAAIGPYSQAIKVNNMVFTSGQIPLKSDGGFVAGDIRSQTEQVCKNIEAVLQEAGSSMTSVIKTTVFITDIGFFSEFNEVYGRYFAHKPARSTVVVKDLPMGSKVEIECVALSS